MSRTDYTVIADALRTHKPVEPPARVKPATRADYNARLDQWLTDVSVIATACASRNPRFNNGRFITACGVVG